MLFFHFQKLWHPSNKIWEHLDYILLYEQEAICSMFVLKIINFQRHNMSGKFKCEIRENSSTGLFIRTWDQFPQVEKWGIIPSSDHFFRPNSGFFTPPPGVCGWHRDSDTSFAWWDAVSFFLPPFNFQHEQILDPLQRKQHHWSIICEQWTQSLPSTTFFITTEGFIYFMKPRSFLPKQHGSLQ